MDKDKIIISLGGSLIIPEELDIVFLREFRNLILSYVEKGRKFAIITGGGKVCRKYQGALSEIVNSSDEELDWMGIHTTRFNAQFLKILLGSNIANDEIVINPTLPVDFQKPVLVGAGWEPGNSSDVDAILLAKNLGSKKVINLSNIDYVYESDPRINPDAKKFEKISWSEYRKLIPEEWTPGLSSPFDPVASRMAEENGIEVVIMNGKPLDNLKNYFDAKKFAGTVIS